MKKILSRRILPIVLCVLMLVPMFMFQTSAAVGDTVEPSEDNPLRNVAPDGATYHSSMWNNDSHSKYVNNKVLCSGYQFWRPSSINRPNGAGVDDTMQHFGIVFRRGYYIVDEVNLYLEQYEEGYNNTKFVIKALILGEWVEVGVGYQDQGVPYKVGDSTVTKLTIKLTHPNKDLGEDINTNNIRIECSEYGAYAKRYGTCTKQSCVDRGYHDGCRQATVTSHDWWIVPIVHECELIGYTGYKPEFEVPMGAELSTNAALSGMIGADSSASMRYPALAGDKKKDTSWRAQTRGAQNIWAEFDKEYKITNVSADFSGCSADDTGLELTFNISVLKSGTVKDGVWETVFTNLTATTVSAPEDPIVYTLPEPMTVYGVRIEFTKIVNPNDASGREGRAVLSEIGAEIADGKKCVFLSTYITNAKKDSTAAGNLACFGSAYASSNFDYSGASDVSYIIDGLVSYADPCWIALNYNLGTYVGVTLREKHDVSKIVLYFNDVLGGTTPDHVFSFDVQVKSGEEFVTVARATSYDKVKNQYVVSVEFEKPLRTDDVRIVFTSDALTFPYLKEFEVFEKDFFYSSYVGYTIDSSIRTKGGSKVTTDFYTQTSTPRARYLDKTSPIEYFNIALEHDVEIDWLGK